MSKGGEEGHGEIELVLGRKTALRIHTFSLARASATSYVVRPESVVGASTEGLRLLVVISVHDQ